MGTISWVVCKDAVLPKVQMHLRAACQLLSKGLLGAIAFCVTADATLPTVMGEEPAYIQTVDYAVFESGDLIFRQGEGWAGQALSLIDRTTTYSHVGLVNLVNGRPFVIHASLGSEDQEPGYVRMESLEAFLARDATVAIAIYRLHPDNPEAEQIAVATAQRYAMQQRPFDRDFDLSTPDRLYCTELVWRSYQAANIDLVDHEFDHLVFPLRDYSQPYLLPNRLLSSPYLSAVFTLSISLESSL